MLTIPAAHRSLAAVGRRLATPLILMLAAVGCRVFVPAVDVHTALVSELAGKRLTLPRLSGHWEHMACAVGEEAPVLSRIRCDQLPGTPGPRLAALGRRIRESLRDGGGNRGPALRAQGLWQLLWHRGAEDLDVAIEALQEATRIAPTDPFPLNDLAVVLLVRGELNEDPWDWLRALEYLELAEALDQRAPEVRFNRAVALQSLMATRLARDAWAGAATSEPDPFWRTEAEARRDTLETHFGTATNVPAAADWRPETWLKLAQRDPQAARERALEHVLVEWGASLAAGDDLGAEARLGAARAVGNQISVQGGDESIRQMVSIIDTAIGEPLATLAAGHVAYGRGRSAERSDRRGAIRELRQASRLLRAGGSIAGLWAQARLGFLVMTDPEEPDPHQAYALHEEIVTTAEANRYPALVARGEWGLSLNVGRGGRILEAMPHQARATALFAAARELGNWGRSGSLEAEMRRLMGDTRAALRLGLASLPALLRRGDVSFAHLHFLDAGNLAWGERRLPRAAVAMHDEALRLAQESADPSDATQTLLSRSQLHVRIGDPRAAVADLSAAAAGEPAGRHTLLEGFAMLARARVALLDAPARAAEISTEAVRYFTAVDLPLNLGEALSIRATAYRRVGSPAKARDDLLVALQALASRGTPKALDPTRIAFTRTVRALADELVSILAEDLDEPMAALGATEVARRLLFDDDTSARELMLTLEAGTVEALARLAAASGSRNVRAFWVLPHILLIWNLENLSVSLNMVELDGIALIEDANEYTRRIARRAPGRTGDALAPLAAELARGDADDTALVLVPDPLMLGLPWAALPLDSTRYLVEERLVTVLPSLAAVERAQEPLESRANWTVLSIGVLPSEAANLPPLRRTVDEARAIAGIYGVDPVSEGRFASVEEFTAQIDQNEILHFAGHAVFSASNPDSSHLMLELGADAPTKVYPADLQGPRFERLRIVVLAACSSFGSAGDVDVGLAGLARPFLLRGVDAVVGTLWPLDDDVALEAFVVFHRALRAGASAPAALRAAQLQLRTSSVVHYRDPAAWAGLVVIGGRGPSEGS